MGGWLAHLWQAMWPNTFAPSAFSLAAIGVSHWRQMRQHRKTRQHVTSVTGTTESEAR